MRINADLPTELYLKLKSKLALKNSAIFYHDKFGGDHREVRGTIAMKRSRDSTASRGSGKETVRELERNILEDAKNSNLLLTLRKHMLEGAAEETLAAIHSFRRIFNAFLESGKLETVNAVNKAKSGTKEVFYSVILTRRIHSLSLKG